MVTIALPYDLEDALTEQARQRGMTPEQLAVETLRATFAPSAGEDEATGGTLFDFLAEYIGAVDGSSENLSENSGRHFSDGLQEKQRQGRL
jgi:hypothetical protein